MAERSLNPGQSDNWVQPGCLVAERPADRDAGRGACVHGASELGAVKSDLSGFSMMELFRMEAESHTATLSAGLIALEGKPAASSVIEPLMRAAHSIKGAARIVGLDTVVRIAHALEDCFVAAQQG